MDAPDTPAEFQINSSNNEDIDVPGYFSFFTFSLTKQQGRNIIGQSKHWFAFMAFLPLYLKIY